MAKSKNNKRFNNYVLRGRLRQSGYERWRYVFSAFGKITGQERKFFVELYIVNPGVSPKVAVISQKSRLAISESDLQYALAGTESAAHANDELDVRPSYVLVKAGSFGAGGKQINKFLASSQLSFVRNTEIFKAGDCLFGAKSISGSVSVTAQDLRVRPEYLCNVGSMDWDLKFEPVIESAPVYKRGSYVWAPLGMKTLFSGSVHFDGQEYAVLPKAAAGYVDKCWGEKPNSPYFHISSSNMTSIITGKAMTNSCFSLEGEVGGKLCASLLLDGERYTVENFGFFKRDSILHDCSHINDGANDEKVHWTVSIHKGKMVIDIDLYCSGKNMFVRDYEMPQGKRCLLRILGGNGSGEIRIYKKIGKNLELLEHANVYDSICEYGQTEEIGK